LAKRLVIGNSSNRNPQTDLGTAKAVPTAAAAVVVLQLWGEDWLAKTDASESNSSNVFTPQFLCHANSPTRRP
jgi:hypothetical protein